MAMPDMLASAQHYARQGMRVFPCEVGGKSPLTPHGFKDATVHARVIEDWWTLWPNANIGFAVPEGVVVLDFDPRNYEPGEGVRPEDFPHTEEVVTPGGGTHLYFTVPEDVHFRGRYAPGVDIKAPGKGYTLLPPSMIDGKCYLYVDECRRVDLPEWALKVATREPPREFASWAEPQSPAYFPWDDGSRYGMASVRNAVARMVSAQEGDRHRILYGETKDLCRLVNGGELKAERLADLRDAALEAGLPYEEVQQTMTGAFESVGDEYRTAPNRG